jgi:DDE family transposase
LPCKRPGEVTQAAARPQQGLHRIAPRRRFDQSLQIGHKRPILRRVAPPGTSKWNKIEHRLFSFITINWRGKPLRSYRTVVELIAATTTDTGLKVRAKLDEKKYPKAVKIPDAQLAAVNIFPHTFHGEWNYTISPIPKKHIRRRKTV